MPTKPQSSPASPSPEDNLLMALARTARDPDANIDVALFAADLLLTWTQDTRISRQGNE